MMDLILDVENASDMLADLLEGYNACFCDRCDSKKPAAMTSKICSPPNILTVALRRFCGSTGRKISKDFPFPETFDIRPFMSQPHGPAIKYNLYAVLVHSGTSTWRWHYYSYVKASNGSWYKMNDSLVNKVELSEVLLQKAYLLFYNRSTGAAGSENKEPSDGVDMQSGYVNREVCINDVLLSCTFKLLLSMCHRLLLFFHPALISHVSSGATSKPKTRLVARLIQNICQGACKTILREKVALCRWYHHRNQSVMAWARLLS
uniref:Ubiquitin carboxyl-terminal hydrolase 36 n=1 Tax=Eptatretus burgeri TaxID=7764 RepID=A0A8C4QHS6_EPTBU